MAFLLAIADDEAASRVFDGRFGARLLEVPEIDIDGVNRSLDALSSALPPGIALCVTMKSQFCRPNFDRFGLWAGANEAVEAIAVPSIEDAIQLRLAGATQRILLLYVQDPRHAPLFLRYGCEPAAVSDWWIREMRRHADRPMPMQLWVDSGMGREGLLPDDAIALGKSLSTEELRGLATQLAAVPYTYPDGSSDTPPPVSSPEFTAGQKARFERVRTALDARGARPQCHVAASGALQSHLDWAVCGMVRPGRAIVERFVKGRTRRALEIRTTEHHARVAQVKDLPAGWSVGYFKEPTSSPLQVATLVTAPGVQIAAGPISVLKDGRRHELPLLLAHTGMCVVRIDDAPVEAGDVLDLNHPRGVAHRRFVPIADDVPRVLHDPLRDRTVRIPPAARLALALRGADRSLAMSAARRRYTAAPAGAAP